MSIPFYEFPNSPLLLVGAIVILLAITVFVLAYNKYFNSPLNREIQQKKKALLKEKNEISNRLDAIERELNNL